jgi:thiol-disulfide isomerase/thioredoxin
MKIFLAALCAAVMLLGCVNTRKSDRPLVALRKAPEFTAKNVLGGDLKSDDLKGKVVVVDFWATWCVPCKAEIPEYNEMRRRFAGQDVEFLGVTFESTEKELKKFQAEVKMDYPVIWGTEAIDVGFGGHRGFPTTFLVGKDWKVYRQISGNTGAKMEMLEKDITLLLNKPVEPTLQPTGTPQAKTVVETK